MEVAEIKSTGFTGKGKSAESVFMIAWACIEQVQDCFRSLPSSGRALYLLKGRKQRGESLTVSYKLRQYGNQIKTIFRHA